MDRLKYQQVRQSTCDTYLRIWRQFNNFIIKLDTKPESWEDRTALFVADLIDRGLQSQSVKTYVSAIKRILQNDDYNWNEEKLVLGSLTKATRLINDHVRTRLPIQYGLLELILFETQRIFRAKNQIYLERLYKAIFILGYYGLMRAGEMLLTESSNHTIEARNVHLACNKEKLLIILYSSKTHSKAHLPQKIKISSNKSTNNKNIVYRNFCPFEVIGNYIKARGVEIKTDEEKFFIFKDRAPVPASQARTLLRTILKNLGLNENFYGLHSLRIGRCTDLMKFNYSILEIKKLGRWRSNVVYKYLRQ